MITTIKNREPIHESKNVELTRSLIVLIIDLFCYKLFLTQNKFWLLIMSLIISIIPDSE